MAFESILPNLTPYSMEDESNNDDDNTNKTSLVSHIISNKNSASSVLPGVYGTNHEHHKKTRGKFNNKNKGKAIQQKPISSSRKENTLGTITNEALTSYTSNVWQYALRCPDSNFSICSLCPDNKKISTHNGSTSTLRKHLITKHNLHELALPIEKRKAVKHYINMQRKQELHALCIYCIIKDGRTFNDLHKPGMKKLLDELIPGYEPPSRYMVARRLKRLHIFYYKKLIDDLTHIDYISITLDFWSNQQMKNFLVITGHYFSADNFNLKSTILNFSVVDEEHKSYEISKLLQRRLKELNILHKVVRVTADGAKNIVRALDDIGLGLKRIWCIAHRLHLTITNAFGFWIMKEEQSQDTVTFEMQECTHDLPINQEEMEDTQDFQYNNEFNEINIDLADAIESDDDESSEEGHIVDEELLSDVTHEQILDNWITDVTNTENSYTYDQNLIASVIRKCRTLIFLIKSSTILTLFFDKEREKFNIKRNLCYDVKSRWNSTYCMIDAFLVLRKIIEQLFNQKHNLHINPTQMKKLTLLEPKSDDWLMLSALHTVLKPFFHATKVLSGRDYPSIGLAFYLISRLKCFLQRMEKKENNMIKRFKQLLLSQFVYYFERDDQQIQLLKFHSYFDPIGFTTLTESEKSSIEEYIKKMFADDNPYPTELVAFTEPSSSRVSKPAEKPNLPRMSHKTVIDAFNESIGDLNYTANQCDENKNQGINDDLRNYRKYIVQFHSTHQTDATSSTLFWQTYGQSFPNLAKLARNYLSTPATSVSSESCFSMSSYLARKERARLTADNLASSIFLKDKMNY